MSPETNGFTENKGQVFYTNGASATEVLYVNDIGNQKIYLRGDGISYVTFSSQGEKRETGVSGSLFDQSADSSLLNFNRIDLNFININSSCSVKPIGKQPGYTNYYLAGCREGITNVCSYDKVLYSNIYPNIDLLCYSVKGHLKYDIIVKPGGNVNDVELEYKGANSLRVQEERLSVEHALGVFEEIIPRVYQKIGDNVVDVRSSYILQNERVKFNIGNYDHGNDLVIDPWVTFLGGSSSDIGNSITTDNVGNVIVTGNTGSYDFPVTVGAFQFNQMAASSQDAFIAKFDAAGGRLWATYFGGENMEVANGIAVDQTNNIYISGDTHSDLFPVSTGCFQPVIKKNPANLLAPGLDAFFVKLNPLGQRIWATYYGGTAMDIGYDVAVDANNEPVFSGRTYSNDLTVLSAFQPNNASVSMDCFVLKFDANGNIIFGTYYGGKNSEYISGIEADASNNIFIVGSTNSIDLPITSSALQTKLNIKTVTEMDMFIAKYDASGKLVFSTYFGGTTFDFATAVDIDSKNNIIVAGETNSHDFPVTAGAFQTQNRSTKQSFYNAIVLKISSSLNVDWCTYLGGAEKDYATGVACDNNDNIVVRGDSYSSDFPMTQCSFQNVFKGHECSFVSTFNQNGTLICSGVIGEGANNCPDNESAEGCGGTVAVYKGYAYIVGYSSGNCYPITTNAFQQTHNGRVDVTIAQVCLTSCGVYQPIQPSINANDSSICPLQSVNFYSSILSCDTNNVKYNWSFQGASISSSTNKNPTGIVYNNPGQYNVKLVVETPCGNDSIELQKYIQVNSFPDTTLLSFNIVSASACNNNNASVTINSAVSQPYSYLWSPTGSTSSGVTGLSAGAYNIKITDSMGCSINKSINVPQDSAITSQVSTNDPLCHSSSDGVASVVAKGGSGIFNYSWSTSITNSSVTGLGAGLYTVTLSDSRGCTSVDTAILVSPSQMQNSFSGVKKVCKGEIVTIASNLLGGTPGYSYVWNGNPGSSAVAITLNSDSTMVLKLMDQNGCLITDSLLLQINQLPKVNFYAADTSGCAPLCTELVSRGSPGIYFKWYAGQNISFSGDSTKICFNDPGNYSVKLVVMDANGCMDSLTKNNYIIVHPHPLADFVFSPSGPVDVGTVVNFTDVSSGATVWSWKIDSPEKYTSNLASPSFTFDATGEYKIALIVQNEFGCTDSLSKLIMVEEGSVFYCPNTFTPNGDGVNDVFLPEGNFNWVSQYSFFVYDRWGQLIFQSNDVTKGWDGKCMGSAELAQIDTYVWKVFYKDNFDKGKNYTGSISLLK